MASSTSGPQITLVDKLMILPNLARSIASALLRLGTYPFAGGAKANTLFKDVAFAALRTNLSLISPATEQYANPTTESVYLDFARKEAFQPDTSVVSSGLKLHWLGSKSAEKVLLYFHGGGYALSLSPGHLKCLFEVQNEVAKGHSFSVVVVGYTLSPYSPYPTQLKQAAESLQWLLQDQKKKPGDIFIGGDSAGGNMAMSLLSHLLHPHPEVADKIQLREPLAGAVLISPWIKFATDDDSVKRNATSDMVTPQAADRWSSLFLGGKPLDNYNQPILAELDWFKGLDKQVKDILIWAGGAEVLIDSIELINKKLQVAHSKVEYVVQPGASHVDFILDALLGYKTKAEGTKVIESWIASRV